MLKRKQSISLEEITPQPYLPRSEQIELLSHYKKVDQKKGGISFYDFIQILRSNSWPTFRFLRCERNQKELNFK